MCAPKLILLHLPKFKTLSANNVVSFIFIYKTLFREYIKFHSDFEIKRIENICQSFFKKIWKNCNVKSIRYH